MGLLQQFVFCTALSGLVAANDTAATYEVPGSSCPSADGSSDWSARNLDTIRTIYNLTVYPNNVPIITSGGASLPPNLFSVNATGRFAPVGEFEGFEDGKCRCRIMACQDTSLMAISSPRIFLCLCASSSVQPRWGHLPGRCGKLRLRLSRSGVVPGLPAHWQGQRKRCAGHECSHKYPFTG